MQKRQDAIVNGSSGRPVVGATVTVTTIAGVAATLYTANGTGLITGNSVTTDDNGRYFYYAADGRYTETISGIGITATVVTDIILEDPADGVIFPARTAGRGQNIIATHDLGPFLGDPDPTLRIGYNYTATGNLSQAGEPGAMICIEGYYNDGTGQPKIEMYWQLDGLTGQGLNQFRPWFCIANRSTASILVRYASDLHQFFPADLTGGTSVLDIYGSGSNGILAHKKVTIDSIAANSGLGLTLADNSGTPLTVNVTPSWSVTGAPAIVTGGAYGLSLSAGGLESLRLPYISGAVNFIVAHGCAAGGISFLATDGTDSAIALGITSKGTDPINLYTGAAFSGNAVSTANLQVQILDTASANRNITLTGSNGGNPTIGTSAGNLAITPAVVVAATSGSAIGTTTSSTTVLNLPAGSTAASSMRLAHGAAPTSPVNGDMWTTTAGLFVRVNGATVGPLT